MRTCPGRAEWRGNEPGCAREALPLRFRRDGSVLRSRPRRQLRLIGGSCAPPSILYFVPGTACILVCSNAWSQVPAVLFVGGAIALVPAAISGLLLRHLAEPKGGRTGRSSWTDPFVASGSGILLGVLVLGLVFGALPGLTFGLTVLIALPIATVTVGLAVATGEEVNR